MLLQYLPGLQSLDTFRFYTRGFPLNPHNLLACFKPSSSVKTLVYESSGSLQGSIQIRMEQSNLWAQLTYMLAEKGYDAVLSELLEESVRVCGSWGAQALLCDLPADSPFLDCFKKCGFTLWAKQRIYQMQPSASSAQSLQFAWRTWTSADIPAMEKLYRSLVPGLFQNLEQLSRKAKLGLILKDEQGKCMAFADYDEGPKGVWLQPFIMPQMDEPQLLWDMLAALKPLGKLPVYLSARSYQPWVDSLAQNAQGCIVSEQFLLVKYLAASVLTQHAVQSFGLEAKGVEGSLPLQTCSKK
ncbi:MAG: hypothetical protein VB108_03345 [Anaerolineaceae bacterium]|nr:hypothetical protein [Anaerolineaceae bacterium]